MPKIQWLTPTSPTAIRLRKTFIFTIYLFFQYILEEIFWSGTPLLESVGEHEPHVEELRENIKKAIRKALIPMKAYAREYEKHLEIMNLDINAYVK